MLAPAAPALQSSSGKEKAIEGQEEEVLQAVILADSFNKRFKPLTVNKPRVRFMTHSHFDFENR